MLAESLPIAGAPALVAVATLVAGRCGQRMGGLISAFPAIVGPVLLLDAEGHGAAFAARAATGTLLGLLTLAGFALAYARAASRGGWGWALLCGWAAASGIALVLECFDVARVGPVIAAAVASAALEAVRRALPGAVTQARPVIPRWEVPLRMGLTVLLVVGLWLAADALGPGAGGVLAALPVLASVLAVFTHGRHGPDALSAMLSGMLGGMVAFIAFCAAIALLVRPTGVLVAFAVATLAAVTLQAGHAARFGFRELLRESRETV